MSEMLGLMLAKAPRAGHVKTRLQCLYTAEEACRIHAWMLRHAWQQLSSCLPAVLASDEPDHVFFQQACFGKVIAQGEGDLGDRLRRLAHACFQQGVQRLLIMGSDSPHMPKQRLQQAMQALKTHDVVLGPVEDGGYDCIGLHANGLSLFDAIDWGSQHVYRQSCQQAAAAGLSCYALPMSFDLDTPDDWHRAQACLQQQGIDPAQLGVPVKS